MKPFRIEYDRTEAVWVSNRYCVEVEAESEAEAREMVEDGEVEGEWVQHQSNNLIDTGSSYTEFLSTVREIKSCDEVKV